MKGPHCHRPHVTRNGKKSKGKQKYQCTHCGRQFISPQEMTCRGSLPVIV
ncbi:MAG: hypothetical protein LBP88_07325 [Treponema sp.]|nr:hypothetical protein [Treponema sp.]